MAAPVEPLEVEDGPNRLYEIMLVVAAMTIVAVTWVLGAPADSAAATGSPDRPVAEAYEGPERL